MGMGSDFYDSIIWNLEDKVEKLNTELGEASLIMQDLVATCERLANQLESQQAMEDKYNGWWNPSLATARVWIQQRKNENSNLPR